MTRLALSEAEGEESKMQRRQWDAKTKTRIILGDRDSNPDLVVQSHTSCRWTIPQ